MKVSLFTFKNESMLDPFRHRKRVCRQKMRNVKKTTKEGEMLCALP